MCTMIARTFFLKMVQHIIGFNAFYGAVMQYQRTLQCADKNALLRKLAAIAIDSPCEEDALWTYFTVKGWHTWVGAGKQNRFAVQSRWEARANVNTFTVLLEVTVIEGSADIFLVLSGTDKDLTAPIPTAVQLFAVFDSLAALDNFSYED